MNHDTYLNSYLADILVAAKNVAVLGASPDDKRPSHWISGFLLGKGYHVFPVNPQHRGELILGQRVYGTLAEIEEPIHLVDVFRRSEHLGAIVEEVLEMRPLPSAIWCQLGVRDDAAAARAEAAGIKVVMNRALVSEYPLVYERLHATAQRGHAA
ncbi:CoA-binding protein [Rhizobium sp. AQ_MP]|uniref:CoA-binding protein n=1 Tax=Rhizobium sp. AQ_MP TaxID=2761536 RepID=UPI00163A2904|nr:CoA-binding protein [Rhizobium sp. AQ_MP]MBC2773570.1 CoA-binding protein [Rhizobium sp. AQ_MP]